jgi:hypothetical protein
MASRIPLSQGNVVKNMRGASLFEFVLVFPSLIVVILLAIEVSLMMTDSHLLTSATFSSGQTAIRQLTELGELGEDGLYSLNEEVRSKQLKCNGEAGCSDDGIECSDTLQSRIKRRAAFVMAVTSPKASSLVSGAGINLPGSSGIQSKGASKNIMRLIEGLPAAYLFTTVSDCKLTPNGIKVSIKYFRQGKTPWVSNIIYGLYMLKKYINSDNLELSLDEYYFGVKARSPILDETRDEALGIIEGFEELSYNADEIVNVFTNISDKFPLLKKVLNKTIDVGKIITPMITNARSEVNRSHQVIQDGITAQEGLLTSILYALPEEFRVVPITKTALIAWPTIKHKRGDQVSVGSLVHSNEGIWKEWGKNISELKNIGNMTRGALADKYFNSSN